jgi:hypothetical protein
MGPGGNRGKNPTKIALFLVRRSVRENPSVPLPAGFSIYGHLRTPAVYGQLCAHSRLADGAARAGGPLRAAAAPVRHDILGKWNARRSASAAERRMEHALKLLKCQRHFFAFEAGRRSFSEA